MALGLLILIGGLAAWLTWMAQAWPWAWVWVFSAWAAWLLLCAARSRRRWLRAGTLSLATFVLMADAAEITLQLVPDLGAAAHFEGPYSEGAHWMPDELLGYRPRPATSVMSRRVVDGQAVYEVTYTYDEHGLRAAPRPAATSLDTALFFGGSYTLGEGVSDDETFAHLAGALADPPCRTVNFGFHGHGPHQALAAIRSGRVEDAVDGEPLVAIYNAIPDHVERVSRAKNWDCYGPRFLLEGDEVVLRGIQRDRFLEASPLRRVAIGFVTLCHLARKLPRLERPAGPEDYALFEAVVCAMRDELEARYPSIQFHVVVWEGHAPWRASRERLRERGVLVHHVRRALPDLVGKPIPMIPHDTHPTAEVHRALAEYLAEQVIGRARRRRGR